MERNFISWREVFHKSWDEFLLNLPTILLAIVVLSAGIFIIKLLNGLVSKYITNKAKDPLIADFLVNIVSFILTLALVVLCLGILGWGNITNKILAGAGITTFIIGFALKDIGENFLAGIIMAFRRPFRIGDLIEVQNVKGKVMKMSLRETTVKTLDGRDIYIPNSIILKNPLQNLTIHFLLRNEFTLSVDAKDVENVRKEILNIINHFDKVEQHPAPSVQIDRIEGRKVFLKALFWFKTTEVNAPGGSLRTEIMQQVINRLEEKLIADAESN